LQREREDSYERKSFIRVEWPTYPLEVVVERLKNGYASHIERVCLSMITHKRAVEDTLRITKILSTSLQLPISLLINPTLLKDGDLLKLREAGAERIGVAIDCATQEIFEAHRGRGVNGPHRWKRYWEVLGEVVQVFGEGKMGAHLIVGLGESEEEMVRCIQRVKELGGRTHLFSFYPERGSLLEGRSPANPSQFRRIQLARYLIDHNLVSVSSIKFEGGRISDFGLPEEELQNIINSGRPFQTSGCPGRSMDGACNRPFGDGPPSDIRSYPFPLGRGDIKRIKKELCLQYLRKGG
jgi:biotin synthase